MAIRAIDPRGNMSKEQGRIEISRLGDLEHRVGEFSASIDSMFRKHTDELISEIKRLMQEQTEAIISKLANAEALHFSVEKTPSSQAATEVFEERSESKVRSVHSNVRQTSTVTVHETYSEFRERQEVVAGFSEKLDSLGDRQLSIGLVKSEHDNVESSGVRKPKVIAGDQNTSSYDIAIESSDKKNGKGSSFLSKLGIVWGIAVVITLVSVGEGKLRGKVLTKFITYIYLVVERRTAKVRLNELIKQPEQPRPPAEPPPPCNAYKLPPSFSFDGSEVSGRNARKIVLYDDVLMKQPQEFVLAVRGCEIMTDVCSSFGAILGECRVIIVTLSLNAWHGVSRYPFKVAAFQGCL